MNLTKRVRKHFAEYASSNAQLLSALLIETGDTARIRYRVRLVWDGLEDEVLDFAWAVQAPIGPNALRQHARETGAWFADNRQSGDLLEDHSRRST